MCDGKCSCTRRCFVDETGVKRYSDTGQPVEGRAASSRSSEAAIDKQAYLIRRAQRLEREAFELRRLAADAA